MKITFFGAAHEVTGSCYLLETSSSKILVDCGMFQGSDFSEGRNHDKLPFDAKTIDVVLVTHAHLDHSGRLPKLIRDGFKGKIYLSKATKDLAKIVWGDAYQIMTYDQRKFGLPVLFDEADIDLTYSRCVGVDYHEIVELSEGITAVLKDAGHIFGSSFIEVTADGKTIAFSGDVGNYDMPIIRDTDQLGKPDVMLCESTYGDRVHEPRAESDRLVHDLILEGYKKGGTIMVPSFSIERTQEFLYRLHMMIEVKKTLPTFPIFLDSPMAIKATEVYEQHPEYYDREAAAMYKIGENFLDFPGLKVTAMVNESKMINQTRGPKMVIAGAGMMNGGRILHHALRYIPDPNSTLLIIGYCAVGTLGRRLYEGAEKVRIFNEEVPVRCTIKAIGGLSAHADQTKLVSWIRQAEKLPEKIYCVHGEATSATALAHKLRDDLGVKTFVPEMGETVEV